ncbi:MAG: aminodeoxychorismate synthase component I [Bacteroidales bacterium]|nr:aminodeoxychorismate synthase component I [Bacteroidales bacterium]
MQFINTEEVRISINKAATKQTPYFFTVDYEMSEGLFIENPTNQTEVLFQFNGEGNKPMEAVSTTKAEMITNPISEVAYKSKFEVIQRGLNSGDIDVANLTIRTPIQTNISCREIFLRSQSPYQVYIPERYVSFSPERFVKIENGKISANPMKGTIDASMPNAQQEILSDPKEVAELNATTQSVIKELSLVAHNVNIKRERYIDTIKSLNRTLLQVSSEVEGDLPKDYLSRMGDILFSLLPAASITGSPKREVEKYIRIAEGEPRGYYCGIAGYFDGTKLDTAVLIRFIETDNGGLFFRSGGGITSNSICNKEYQEALDKIYFPFV